MILGILSDTHGRSEIAERAIALLLDRGSEFIIHCGDVGDGVLELLPSGKSAFVFGNTDYDVEGLRRLAKSLDVRCFDHGGIVELGGKRIAVAHGDQSRIMNGFLADEVYYLLTGHTHVAHDRRPGATRMINPGALHRAVRKTVAVLDLETDVLKFETLIDPGGER
jgi:hypothetical protein